MFLKGAPAVRVFLCFAIGYMLSYAFRSVNAVIAPVLMADIGLSNADLGLLSAAYFLGFALLQLPLGIWLDKYGPRRVDAALLLIAALGAAIFALSSSLAGLWLGRALIGVGVSACLMAAYKAFRLWYAPARQTQLTSWMLMAGSAGALISTVPVNAALPILGWRGIFLALGAMVVLAAAAILFLLKKVEIAHAASPAPSSSAQAASQAAQGGYATIFRNAYFRRVAPLALINNGSFTALQTLWIGPWMITVLGMSKQQSAEVLFVFNLALMLAYLGLSWMAPRYFPLGGRQRWRVTRVISVGLLGAILVQAAMLLITAPWAWVLWIILAVFITMIALIQTSVGMSFPTALAGRANTAYNVLLFSGVFLMQWGIGVLIDVFKAHGASPSMAMRAAFAVCAGLQAASLLAFAMNRAEPDRP